MAGMAALTEKEKAFGRIKPALPPKPAPERWVVVRHDDSQLPDNKNEWFKLSTYLTDASLVGYAFHDSVILHMPPQSFASVASVVKTGVQLAFMPEMGLIPLLKDVLRELVAAPTLPMQPGQIDVRAVYARALLLLEAGPDADEKTQPELRDDFRTRLSFFCDYICTIPLRMQGARLNLPRQPDDANPLPPSPQDDTRPVQQLMAEAATHTGLPPPAAARALRPFVLGLDSSQVQLSELGALLAHVVDTAYAAPGLIGHAQPDPVWLHQHDSMKLCVSFGSEYCMRTTLWCVSMFWAAMVWRGDCGICGEHLSGWNTHHWLKQIQFAFTVKSDTLVSTVIDQWHSRNGYELIPILRHSFLNCTSGSTACGRKALIAHRFGAVLSPEPAAWALQVPAGLRLQEHITYDHVALAYKQSARVVPPPRPPKASKELYASLIQPTKASKVRKSSTSADGGLPDIEPAAGSEGSGCGGDEIEGEAEEERVAGNVHDVRARRIRFFSCWGH